MPEADLFALGRFELKAAEVEWVDDAVAPSVHAVPRVDVRLDDLRVGSTIDAASSLRVVLQVPEIIAALEVSGQVNASTVSPSFDFTIDGRGIEAGPLAAYLPPEVRATIEDGALRARLRASIAPHDEGGTSARLEVEGVDYRGAGDLGPLFGCGAARIVARRVDPDAGIIALDEIAIEGVEARVRRTSSGSFSAFGIEVVVAPAATEGEAPAEGLPETTPVAEAAPVGPADGVASTGGVSSTLPIAAPDVEGSAAPRLVLRGDLPLLTLEKLSLHLASLTVTDESGEGAAPVEIADWTFANAAPIRLLGPDTAEPTPLALTLRGRVDPLIDQVAVDIRGAPFASEPEFSVDVAVTGIHGPQLVKVAPAVAETMHANELVDGEFRLHTQATLRAKRRDALDFSLANGFGLEFLLSGLDLRRKGDEASLLGLDELRVDVARVAPTGDVHVRSIEIAKPRAIIRRDEEGLHVLGLVVKLPEPAPAETDAAAEGPAAVPEIAATEIAVTSEVASNSVAQPAPEFKLDQLVISGVDLLIEDTTGSRPTILPIDELEVELKQFTTLTFTENRPFRFSVYVGAGDVELPKRLEKSFLAGALSDLATIAVGGDVAGETERRSVFEEITASGKLSLHEPYSGWVKTGVSALELAALRGIVEPSGVVITDGVLDSRASVRFEPDGTMDVDTRSSFIRLAVTEPANGPITRYLKLPAPLDQVLFVLRDQEGATTLPAAFALPGGEISPASISLAAARAIGTVIVDAFTAAPLRAAGTALELVGLQGASAKEDLSSLAVRLDFTAGDVAVLEAQRAKLEPLLEKLRDDETLVLRVQHEFGALDLERSAELANPSREDLLELASRLTERRRELLRERDSLAAEAKAFFAASRPDRADGLRERIQARDREIGEAELALDDVYARLRPGAERQADRRTRAAAIDLARLRLQSVERALLQTAGVPEIDRRIQANPARFSEPTSEGGGGIVVTPVVSAERK